MLEDACRQAGVSPLRVRFVEAHGTGTRVGDPAEVEGLNRVLGAGRPKDQPCFIGSGKTNIGHSEGAAGIAGLIKAALILKHRTIPPSLHCANPNPNIPWDNIPFIVQQEAAAWPAGDYPALAGVNSFGIFGTNAHAVLEEAPPAAPAPRSPQRAPGVAQILPISAKTEDALRALARSYRERLHEAGPDAAALCDICYTAAVRRSHQVHRLALVGHSTEQMRRRIDAFLEAEPRADRSRGAAEAPKPVFVFSGVGSHWPSMGRKLRDVEPVFRNVLLRCDDIVRRLGGWSLIEAIDAPPDESLLDRIDIMQPAIFGVQAALAALRRSWGIEPAAVVGHSLGEYAAAHVAGAITLEEGLRAVSIRGRLMHRWRGLGRMLAVELTPDTAREEIAGYADSVSLAAWNSPASSVLSGDPAALNEVMDRLQREGVFCRWVKVDVACHSGQMETILGEYREALGALRPRPESIPISSTVTAGRLSGEDLDAEYWARNVRDPVLFAPLIESLLANGNDTFLEVSPHPVLLAPMRQMALHSSRNVETLSSLKREHDERAALLESLAGLYVAGYPVDWRNLHPAGGRVVSLPAYPWQRERFWFEPPRESRRSKQHPLLPVHWESAENPGAHVWESELDLTVFPYLADHRFQGVPLLPVAAYIEMALAASIEVFGRGPRVFRNVELLRPLFLSERQPRRIQLVMSPARPGYAVFRFYSLEQAAWVVCVKGMVQYEGVEFEEVADTALSPETLSRDYSRQLDAATFYSRAGEAGLEYRWAFRAVERAGYSAASGRGMIVIQPFRTMGYSSHGYHIHPARLDAMFQSAVLRVMSVEDNALIASLPVEIGELQVHALPPDDAALSCRVKLHPREEDLWRSDVEVFDEGGRLILRDLGHRSKLVRDTKRDVPRSDTSSWLYQVRWESEPPAATVHTGSESWLILADSGGLGERLRDALEAAGDSCGLVPAGRLEAVAGILAANPPKNMLYLWPLDAPRNEALSLESLAGSQRQVCGSVLSLVHTLANRDGVSAPRLWIVTRGAQPVTPQAGPASLAQAPLLGLARVIANEHRELLVTAVDLDPACPPGEAAALVAELRIAQPGQEVAYRDDVRYVARLFRYNPQSDLPPIRPIIASVSSDRSYELTTRGGGVLKNLMLREVARRPPGPGEIEIQVSVAGLNFLDVLKALDMAPGLPPGPVWFGMECAGRVAALGEGVAGFQLGDEVIARDVSVGCLRAFLTAPAGSVFRKPPHLTLAEAATIPVAYQTAYYALHHLARLSKGESALIHSAAGGVGLAALEIARQAGAEVSATAGTPEKREYLRSLGFSYVMNSRTLEFAREIMTYTGGRGVDVVLNSLAGEAIPKSLSVLAAGGRFLEIGKRDIYANSQLGLLPFQKNLAFFAIDLLRLSMECPETYAALSGEVQSRIADGAFKPLPYTSFPIARVPEAFSFMTQGKHTGKIVVEMDGHEIQAGAAPVKACAIRSDAAYLITGGLGGLGLSVAQWLVAQGARHLVLVGRRGPTPEVQPALDSLRETGARIEVSSADVSRPEDLASVLGHVRGTMPPWKGVVHCAGVLSDGVVQRLDWPRFETVFAPKLQGAWNLHVQLLGTPLDFFVLFSSVASVFGSPAQGNYAAANAFLDSLAHYRAARGLPALAINWGPWAEVGMAAQPNRGGRLAELGTESIPPNDGVRVLGDLLGERSPQVAVVPINWKRPWNLVRSFAGRCCLPASPPSSRTYPPPPATAARKRSCSTRSSAQRTRKKDAGCWSPTSARRSRKFSRSRSAGWTRTPV